MGTYPFLAAVRWFEMRNEGDYSVLTTDYTIIYADNWWQAVSVIENHYGTDLESILELKKLDDEGPIFIPKKAYDLIKGSYEGKDESEC